MTNENTPQTEGKAAVDCRALVRLLPCPFCGRIPEEHDGDYVLQHANECFFTQQYAQEMWLVSSRRWKAWNTRPNRRRSSMKITISTQAASEIHAFLLQEANNLECDSTYEESGIDRKKIPYRARVAIRREIERIRALAAELKPT